MLLDGHLNITKELLQFQSAEKKHLLGCHPHGSELISDLIEHFIFPASCLFKKYRDALLAVTNMRMQHLQQTSALSSSSSPSSPMNISLNSETINALNSVEQMLASKSLKSICSSSMTTSSAFDLLVALCNGCLPNFVNLSDLLFNLFYPSLIGGNSSNSFRQQTSLGSSNSAQHHSMSLDFCGPR